MKNNVFDVFSEGAAREISLVCCVDSMKVLGFVVELFYHINSYFVVLCIILKFEIFALFATFVHPYKKSFDLDIILNSKLKVINIIKNIYIQLFKHSTI